MGGGAALERMDDHVRTHTAAEDIHPNGPYVEVRRNPVSREEEIVWRNQAGEIVSRSARSLREQLEREFVFGEGGNTLSPGITVQPGDESTRSFGISDLTITFSYEKDFQSLIEGVRVRASAAGRAGSFFWSNSDIVDFALKYPEQTALGYAARRAVEALMGQIIDVIVDDEHALADLGSPNAVGSRQQRLAPGTDATP